MGYAGGSKVKVASALAESTPRDVNKLEGSDMLNFAFSTQMAHWSSGRDQIFPLFRCGPTGT